jgi:hypothetical protein
VQRTLSDDHLKRGLEAVCQAAETGLAAHPKADIASEVLTGLSGQKLTGSLQRLTSIFLKDPNACYLEIGVFQGLTIHSVAAANPNIECYGIDNFAQHDPNQQNISIFKERKRALRNDNAHLINDDYEDALESLDLGGKKIGVYFVDGPHDYRSQLMCLELAVPFLHDQVFVVIDDCNYNHVRQANRDFLLTHPEFKLLFQAYSQCHPMQLDSSERLQAYKGWWNGVNILCRDQNDILDREYPPTERNRRQFELDHLVHAHGDARAVMGALSLYYGIRCLSIKAFARGVLDLFKSPKSGDGKGSWFESMNTDSHNLPKEKINSYLVGNCRS